MMQRTMKNLNLVFLLGLSSLVTFTSCTKTDDDDTPTTSTLTLDLEGLEDLGDGYAYEGWIMVAGSPVSAGVFTVDADGNLSQSTFQVDADDLASASAYILTIEPSPDSDPLPSDIHILAGEFSDNQANVTVEHPSALGTDFTGATGDYILATPTDGDPAMDEASGVWWLNPAGAAPVPTLDLPALPEKGWEYEGWAVIDGTPVSTGRFTKVDSSDSFNGYSGTAASAPPFPGEDFLMNAPSGLTFPTDLSEGVVVISVEPVPDNSDAPFVLKPLVGAVPASAQTHTLLSMDNNASATNPKGTVSR